MTGTIDNVEEINYLLQELEKQYNIKFYIHVDAAIGGLVFPFISDSEFAFKYFLLENLYSFETFLYMEY